MVDWTIIWLKWIVPVLFQSNLIDNYTVPVLQVCRLNNQKCIFLVSWLFFVTRYLVQTKTLNQNNLENKLSAILEEVIWAFTSVCLCVRILKVDRLYNLNWKFRIPHCRHRIISSSCDSSQLSIPLEYKEITIGSIVK